MPRKTTSRAGRMPAATRRFNEAAARCRGKRALDQAAGQHLRASMRPRPDAAENGGLRAGERTGSERASMRPRPDAAENNLTRSSAAFDKLLQ